MTDANTRAREPWLIWSHEHNAFWNPYRAGYTRHIERAGRYSREEAETICCNADYRSGSTLELDHLPPEVCFPAPEAAFATPARLDRDSLARMLYDWQPCALEASIEAKRPASFAYADWNQVVDEVRDEFRTRADAILALLGGS